MKLSSEIDPLSLVNTIALVVGGVYAVYLLFSGPELHISRPKMLIIYADTLPSGAQVPGISIDISVYNAARQDQGAVIDSATILMNIDGSLAALQWSSIHEISLSDTSQELTLVLRSQPKAIHLPGNHLESHRFGFVDTFCVNRATDCAEARRDFVGFVNRIAEVRTINLKLTLDMQPSLEASINCTIWFSELDIVRLAANDWIAKTCAQTSVPRSD